MSNHSFSRNPENNIYIVTWQTGMGRMHFIKQKMLIASERLEITLPENIWSFGWELVHCGTSTASQNFHLFSLWILKLGTKRRKNSVGIQKKLKGETCQELILKLPTQLRWLSWLDSPLIESHGAQIWDYFHLESQMLTENLLVCKLATEDGGKEKGKWLLSLEENVGYLLPSSIP